MPDYGRLSSEFAEVALTPDPLARLVSEFAEVALTPDPLARLVSEFAEVALVPASAGRLASLFAEVLLIPGVPVPPTCLARQPAQYFILPDARIAYVADSSAADPAIVTEAGPSPGPVAPTGVLQGRLVPVQSGTLTDDSRDVAYALANAGGVSGAEFVYRRGGTVAIGNVMGKDDIRHWWGFHSPFAGANPGADNNAVAYSSRYRRLLMFGVNDASTAATIHYRDIDSDRYDDWTASSVTLLHAAATGGGGAQMLELADGRIMLVIRTPGPGGVGGPTYDFDVYHSDDGGITFGLVSRRIVTRFSPSSTFPVQRLDVQVRLARAGEFIRLCFVDNTVAGRINTWLSRDRGISWTPLAVGPVGTVLADASDPVPFDIVGLDDGGTFLMAAIGASASTAYETYSASGVSGWVYQSLTNLAGTPDLKAAWFIRHPLWIYLFIGYSDGTGGTTDGYDVIRFRPEDFGTPANQQSIVNQQMNLMDGSEWNPCRMMGVWAGSAQFHTGGRKDEATGTALNLGTAWYAEAWTERSLGLEGPSRNLGNLDPEFLWDEWWTIAAGRPSDAFGTGWTQVLAGTASDAATPNFLHITGLAPGDALYYNHAGGGAGGLAYDTGGLWRWVMRLDTGDSLTAATNVGVRWIAENAANNSRYMLTFRIGPTSVVVHDDAAAVVLATISGLSIDTGSSGGFTEFRFRKSGANGQLAIYDFAAGVWHDSASFVMSVQAGAGAASKLEFGHLAQTLATTMESWWREVMWTVGDTQLNQNHAFPITDLADAPKLFGAPCAPQPQYVEHGLMVAWAGVGGAEGNSWLGALSHAYPVDAVLVDSPRIEWRSTVLTTQKLILAPSFGLSTSVYRWRHDAIAFFGCNNRHLLVDYDSDPAFGSPTSVQTVDFTRYGTAATPRTIAAVNGNTLVMSEDAGYRWQSGELVGLYVRMTSGGANGLTWKITRQPSQGALQFDEETTTLAAQGAANTDTFVIFGGTAAHRYSAVAVDGYLRIRTTDSDTAEGYHKIGTVVVGRALDIDVPLDWAFTDDEQPNVTMYRTKGGVSWGFEEGPPQRTITGRVVGDASQWRQKFRSMIRNIGYEARACALVLDDERNPETVILGRVTSGSGFDNAGWKRDANDDIRPMGDMSLTFTEEP